MVSKGSTKGYGDGVFYGWKYKGLIRKRGCVVVMAIFTPKIC
jgi:hypothetical protein